MRMGIGVYVTISQYHNDLILYFKMLDDQETLEILPPFP